MTRQNHAPRSADLSRYAIVIIVMAELFGGSLWFSVTVGLLRRTVHNVPWIQGSVTIDSRSPSWFHASLSTVEPDFSAGKSTWFTVAKLERDQLGIGRCDGAELPRWLANAAAHLDVEWTFTITQSSLRGAKRERALAWLRGET